MIAIGKPFVDTLVENHITIREYFIIYCYVYDKVHLLRDYNAVQRAKVEDVTNLVKNKEFLQIKKGITKIDLDSFEPTPKGIRFIKLMVDSFEDAKSDNPLLGHEDLADIATAEYAKDFDLFYKAYPASVMRRDGAESSLRLGKKEARNMYIELIRSKKYTAARLMELLKYYVDNMTRTGNMMYMKTMRNWFKDEVYVDLEEHMKENNNKPNNSVDYGGKLL